MQSIDDIILQVVKLAVSLCLVHTWLKFGSCFTAEVEGASINPDRNLLLLNSNSLKLSENWQRNYEAYEGNTIAIVSFISRFTIPNELSLNLAKLSKETSYPMEVTPGLSLLHLFFFSCGWSLTEGRTFEMG